MNYRHHFHAGNFADVFKHVLLLDLVAAMQRKEKGFLYLDTHAGRGMYHLTKADTGDRLERAPEYPLGIGRIQSCARPLPAMVADYLATVGRATDGDTALYPGSPALVFARLRPQDRMHLCELHPEDQAALGARFGERRKVSVHASDGYNAVRAALPPPEKRALVLIDPPFESQEEYHSILGAVDEALRRLPGATIAIWHPLSDRADPNEFFDALAAEAKVPAVSARIETGAKASGAKLWGCGVTVLNPPWGFETSWRESISFLGDILAQGSGAQGIFEWLVPER